MKRKLIAWIIAGCVATGAASSGVTYAVVNSGRDPEAAVVTEELTTAAPSDSMTQATTALTAQITTAAPATAVTATISKKATASAVATTAATTVTTTKKREVTTVTETTEKVYKDVQYFPIDPIAIDLGEFGSLKITNPRKGTEGFAVTYIGEFKKKISFISATDSKGNTFSTDFNFNWFDWEALKALRYSVTIPEKQKIEGYIEWTTTDFAALSTVTITYQFEGEEPGSFTINLPL
jgi:hypothetical protein